MYICYVDESGHVGEKADPNEPVEVVCGVVSDLTKLTKSQREHRRRLDELEVPELKASDTYRGRRDWARVKAERRDEVYGQVLQWATERHCKFVVAPIDCSKFFARKNAN